VRMGYFDNHLKRLSDVFENVSDEEEFSRFRKELFDYECTFESIPRQFIKLIEFAINLLREIQAMRQANREIHGNNAKEIEDDFGNMNERINSNAETNLQSKRRTESRGTQDKYTNSSEYDAKRRQANREIHGTNAKEIEDDLGNMIERININAETNLQLNRRTESRGIQDKSTSSSKTEANRKRRAPLMTPYSTMQNTSLKLYLSIFYTCQ